MKKHVKIAVIGGGSSYTPELIDGIIRNYPDFPVKEVVLVDIEAGQHKQNIVGALAKRMIERSGLPIKLHMTLNRRDAIQGADFVITQLRVGLLAARAKDERIPLRYNRIGQETTGAGGFAKALRTIPIILDICKDIQELAPDAFLLNFTNPAGIVTEAVLKYGNVKSIGLCNLPLGTKMQIAEAAGVSVQEVDIEMMGINHLNWTTRIMVNQRDITQQILSKATEEGGFSMKNIPELAWDKEFLLSLGALPCGYHRYYYMPGKMLQDIKDDLDQNGVRAEVVKKVEDELFELYQDPQLVSKPEQLDKRGGAYYSEAAVHLMSSIYNNKKDHQIVNVKNNGLISCLPDDASIEVKCVIDSEGAHPVLLSTPVTPQIRGLLQIVKAYEELTVEAAVNGDLNAAMQALSIHPLVGAEVAPDMLQDILEENNRYLPQFK